MTNSEAIKMLRLIKSTCYLGNRKFLEAIDVAIEALRKQDSKYYELGKKIMEDVQNALLYGTKGKEG